MKYVAPTDVVGNKCIVVTCNLYLLVTADDNLKCSPYKTICFMGRTIITINIKARSIKKVLAVVVDACVSLHVAPVTQ